MPANSTERDSTTSTSERRASNCSDSLRRNRGHSSAPGINGFSAENIWQPLQTPSEKLSLRRKKRRELAARALAPQDRLGPTLAGSEHVAVRESAAGGQALEPVERRAARRGCRSCARQRPRSPRGGRPRPSRAARSRPARAGWRRAAAPRPASRAIRRPLRDRSGAAEPDPDLPHPTATRALARQSARCRAATEWRDWSPTRGERARCAAR